MKHVLFQCTGTPDDAAMKAQLSAIPGVVEMNIDSKSHSVDVRYDDTHVSRSQIQARLDTRNYQIQL